MKKGQIVNLIEASRIRRNERNRVPSEDDVGKMADSIKEVGVLQPITVRVVDDQEDLYEVVMGETRWRGCLSLDEAYEVPCIVRQLGDKEVAELLAVENFQRKNLNPVQEAEAMQYMLDMGHELEHVCEAVGLQKEGVKRRLSLFKLPDSGRESVAAEKLDLWSAYEISRLPEDVQARALKDCVGDNELGRPLTQWERIDMLKERYILPIKRRRDWEKKRKGAMDVDATASWLEYDEAERLGADRARYERCDMRPKSALLNRGVVSDSVPTWGELADRFEAEKLWAMNPLDGEPMLIVEWGDLWDHEVARCKEEGVQCFFRGSGVVVSMTEEEEKGDGSTVNPVGGEGDESDGDDKSSTPEEDERWRVHERFFARLINVIHEESETFEEAVTAGKESEWKVRMSWRKVKGIMDEWDGVIDAGKGGEDE